MPWQNDNEINPPVRQRGVSTGAAGAEILQNAGYDIGWVNRLRLGVAKMLGQLEPVEKALPDQVMGVPTKGRERMADLVEFLRPFASRPNFGKNPQDAEDVLDAFAQRSLGLGDVETQQASNLLKVYRNVMAKKRLQELGVFEPEAEEPARGLAGVMQMRRQGQAR